MGVLNLSSVDNSQILCRISSRNGIPVKNNVSVVSVYMYVCILAFKKMYLFYILW